MISSSANSSVCGFAKPLSSPLANFGLAEKGLIKLSTYLVNFRVGDIVDIKANGAQQKGMPHKYYHGFVSISRFTPHVRFTYHYSRTGIVYNVTPRAVGVIINKIVGNRYIEKRVNIRIEHIRHSGCRQEFLDRVKRNTATSAEAKKSGGTLVSTKLNGAPSDIFAQSVLSSSGCQCCPVPATPSRRRKTLLRRLSLFHMRPPFDFVPVLYACNQTT